MKDRQKGRTRKVMVPPGPEDPDLRVSTSSHGAAAELVVCADLLAKGYHVFRSVSPTAVCDLVALDKTGTAYRIEVKSALGPNPVWPATQNWGTRFDTLAAVNRIDNSVTYWHAPKERP